MNAKSHNPLHKFLSGLALAGLILSLCLGSRGATAARAQAAWTDTPTGSGAATALPTDLPTATPPPTATVVPTDLPTATPPPTETVAPTEPATPPAATLHPAEPARPGMPPIQPHPVIPNQPGGLDLRLFAGGGNTPVQSKAGAGITPESIALGASGLSFRYLQMYGTSEVPYFADTTHLNRPEGLFMDASNNLYVTENQGERLLRYNSSRANTLAIGKAGVSYTDDYVFSNISDSALDSGGHIWVVDNSRVVQYDSSGTILQSFPTQDNNPWETGDTNDRFNNARGIAFGSDGRMYVSDSNNNRIQVFTMGTGSPVYDTTIGGTSGDSNSFNAPNRIAVYGDSDLYVVDTGNNQVQHCIYGTGWVCSTLDSGLNNPQGIIVDGSQNVYIADTNNGRIRKCTAGGVCIDFVTDTYWSYDLALDSSGNIYSATSWDATVVRYDKNGTYLGIFLGVDQVPYLTDGYHYNHPRVAIDSSNNIIIVEENGQRLIKLNSSGVLQWSVGTPGVDQNDDTHFNWPHGVAVDGNGNIYIADGFRVQIYSGSGTLLYSFGSGDDGTHGNTMFGWAAGIAVDNTGNIYVSDCNNNRVQIFNSSRNFMATLAPPGSSDGQLDCPIGLAVDSARNVYVVDAGNNRVQKFNSSHVWRMSIGVPGPWGSGSNDFDHFGGGPEDVTVDAQGRIYVADIWNNRVQVFDSTGAYMTTIGNAWGNNTSQFRNTSGVDVDSLGNVYVSDFGNARIQKYALGVPGWVQSNLNGFGAPGNQVVTSLGSFGSQLYAGTYNVDGTGAQLWRSSDGKSWSEVIPDGFGDATNVGIDHLIVFNGYFYAGTWNSLDPNTNDTNGGQIWRSATGNAGDWTKVVDSGFGDPTNGEVFRFGVFNNMLYASTWSYTGDHGGEVWRSASGAAGDWTEVVNNGLGEATNNAAISLVTFDGSLYAGTYSHDLATNRPTGCEIWRSLTGNAGEWTKVITDGFGNIDCSRVTLAAFGDSLYAGTGILNPDTGTSPGGQVWRCTAASGCDTSSDWTLVIADGFGNPQNRFISSLSTLDNQLYAVTQNNSTGMEVWSTSNGSDWGQVGFAGFGDSNNQSPYWNNSIMVFNNGLFIGTENFANGGEIWELLHKIFLPLVMR